MPTAAAVANARFAGQTTFVDTFDLICIGAGPTGLACAIEAKRAGLRPLVIDKGCLCNSIFHYPVNMVFFTTPELLEIGDLPLTSPSEKPTRAEALKYYRKCAEHYALDLRLGRRVEKVEGSDGRFQVHTRDEQGTATQFESKKIVVATGYYDLPNRLRVPGEDLPHVSHYYTEPHPFWHQEVVVIGGKNSAAEAALDLYRSGANVTLVHRRAELASTIKYWVRPDIEKDRKSTRLNSSHQIISYAVFCLKKKKKKLAHNNERIHNIRHQLRTQIQLHKNRQSYYHGLVQADSSTATVGVHANTEMSYSGLF